MKNLQIVMDPMDLTQLVTFAAAWHHLFVDNAIRDTVYIRAPRVAFDRGPRWEPWNDPCIPSVRFVELFRMALGDFIWLADELREDLAQDPIGRGQPLSVEAQVGVSLYRLAHGTTYVTIGKETSHKGSSCFVNAVIKVFWFCAVK